MLLEALAKEGRYILLKDFNLYSSLVNAQKRLFAQHSGLVTPLPFMHVISSTIMQKQQEWLKPFSLTPKGTKREHFSSCSCQLALVLRKDYNTNTLQT